MSGIMRFVYQFLPNDDDKDYHLHFRFFLFSLFLLLGFFLFFLFPLFIFFFFLYSLFFFLFFFMFSHFSFFRFFFVFSLQGSRSSQLITMIIDIFAFEMIKRFETKCCNCIYISVSCWQKSELPFLVMRTSLHANGIANCIFSCITMSVLCVHVRKAWTFVVVCRNFQKKSTFIYLLYGLIKMC